MLKTFCTRLLPGLLWLAACGTSSPPTHSLQTQEDSLSYLVGMDIARVYSRNEIALDPALIYQGYQDVLNARTLALDEASATQLSVILNQRINEQQQLKAQREAAENAIQSQMFLRENGQQKEVVALASGLQYRVIQQGTGVPPTTRNEVRVSFVGKLINGTVFSSTYAEADSSSVVAVERVLPGLTEALLKMKPGARWEIVLPPDLGYGSIGKEQVPPNAVLIFDLSLLEIVR